MCPVNRLQMGALEKQCPFTCLSISFFPSFAVMCLCLLLCCKAVMLDGKAASLKEAILANFESLTKLHIVYGV